MDERDLEIAYEIGRLGGEIDRLRERLAYIEETAILALEMGMDRESMERIRAVAASGIVDDG